MKLNNPIADFYKQAKLRGKIITIPEEEMQKSTDRINSEMEKYAREFRYKCAKSEEEAMHHYITF